MPKFYVYVTERVSQTGGYYSRDVVFQDIYEAPDKDAVKSLLLNDFEHMTEVRQKVNKKVEEPQFITTIFELNDHWEAIWFGKHLCIWCKNEYTKLEKAKQGQGGTAEYCSRECYAQHKARFELDSQYNTAWVYQITHIPTGQIYVGVTIRWLMQRWWEHLKAESGSPLHQLIKSDGPLAFTFQILEEFDRTKHNEFEREKEWIDKLNTVLNGLNAVNGHKVVKKLD